MTLHSDKDCFPEEIAKAFAKVQTGLEIFLVNQLKDRRWDVDRDLIKNTMSFLISAIPLAEADVDRGRVLVELLKAEPNVLSVFCEAIRIKVALMSLQGLPSEGLKIVKNLSRSGVQGIYIDKPPLPPVQFVSLANDFVLSCNTLESRTVPIDEQQAYRDWHGLGPDSDISIGDMHTVRRNGMDAPSVGDGVTMGGDGRAVTHAIGCCVGVGPRQLIQSQ